ncbi:MAG: EF2563 family selenium-dependent molybdenum hydroxylase system protein [Chloroflexi bacterium]|nr:EF2563 family selenium-dependent molybdenum hydroxylase system protein [Chloroflexota bacterium]
MTEQTLVLIRGGGDLGSGVAHRLFRAGFQVLICELAQPTVIRRAVSFASAIYEGHILIEGVEGRWIRDFDEAGRAPGEGFIPVLVDPAGQAIRLLRPGVVVDARLAKRRLDTCIADAEIVIGLGPGFVAGQDVHAVVETMRGHDLGRVILEGSAAVNTRIPGLVQGYGRERVLWAPCTGHFVGCAQIGELIHTGQTVALVSGHPVSAGISGVLRGLLHDGLCVQEGQKVGDVDPRGLARHCFSISDKSRAVAGGVLEAILYLQRRLTSTSSYVKVSTGKER